ncbi:MFS transporter [Methanobacterium paludis]|uniref:Major facilitator superfamily MFS_1 n=1 Tax=Methanobacterium paludis (strain DSM 25820 / JCM 18151 / SWAN1) TaxID=868131 RepID=F6D4W5_METPW|nr:MFS transporter [Methanobacterium paludis]AEG18174.1 major facilitator superfamily MFS_1 [Methanobacterium paludis]
MENKLWSRNFLFILLLTFFMYIGYSVLVVTLPLYVKNIGGNSTEMGLIVSLFAVAALISRPVAGHLLDNYGRERVYILGLISITIVTAFFCLPLAIILLLVVRFGHGFVWGITSTANSALTVDVVPKELLVYGWRYFVFAQSMTMAAGPIIGSFVMLKFGFTPTALLVTFLMVICIVMAKLIKYPKFEKPQAVIEKKFNLKDMFEKNALFPSLLATLLMMTLGFVMAFVVVYGQQIGVNGSLFFVGLTLMILLSNPIVNKLNNKYGDKSVLIISPLCVIMALIIMSLANGLIPLIIASLFYGFGYGVIGPILQTWAVNASPEERVGAANGTYLASLDVGIALGSLIFGTISGYIGLAKTFSISSICMVTFLVLYILNLHRKRNKISVNG